MRPPSTIDTTGNTALRVSRNDETPTPSTTSPMPASTVSRTRSGTRRPSSSPTPVPATTVATLTMVPRPRMVRAAYGPPREHDRLPDGDDDGARLHPDLHAH